MIEISQETIDNRDMVQEYYYLSITCGDSQGVLALVGQYSEAEKFSLRVNGLVVEIHILVNLADLVTEDTWEKVKPYRSGDMFAEVEYMIGMEILKSQLEKANRAALKMIAEQSKKALTQGNKKV